MSEPELQRRPLAREPHARGLSVGLRVVVRDPVSGKRAHVWATREGEKLLRQPLTVRDGGLPGWIDSEVVIEWDGGSRVRATTGARADRKPKQQRQSPGVVRRASDMLREVVRPARAQRPGVTRAASDMARENARQRADAKAQRSESASRIPGEFSAVALTELPDAIEIAIGDGDPLATVSSPVNPLSAASGLVFVDVAGFGITGAGEPYWDPAGADLGEEATVLLHPFTLELTLVRETSV